MPFFGDATTTCLSRSFSAAIIMRLSLRAAGFLALAIVAITCTDAPTGPNSANSVQTARLRMSPYFSSDAAKIYNSLSLFGQEVTEVHIHLTAADGTQRDTVINFPAGSDSLVIEIPVPISGTDQQFNAVIELRNDQHTVLFSGTQIVIARAANLPPLSPPAVHIEYTGPGKGTKTITLSPGDQTVNATAATPFQASAVDSSGKPVTDLLVRWTTSDATLATVTTTSSTTASVTGLGKRGTVTISAITPSGIVGTSRLTLVPPAARIVVISGGGQSAVAGSTLPLPFIVEVQASDNLPVPAANVAFRSISAGGTVSQASAATDVNGRASVTLKLPTTAGTHLFEASSAALTPVTVSETATAAQPAAIAIVAGDQQTDSVGRTLPAPLIAKVTDQFGAAVSGATVAWAKVAGAGTINTPSIVTGADGLASTTYTLGNVVGTEAVSATVNGVAGAAGSVSFTLHTIARRAGAITIESGGGQSGLPGALLGTPLTAKVVDALNNPVANASVTWSSTNSGITFSPSSGTTTGTGVVSAQVTLGGAVGPATVTATTGALSASTTLTVTSLPVTLPPTITKTAGDGQSAVAGTALVVNPTVLIKDGNGTPVVGAPVVFAVASGGGVATGTSTNTNAQGVATVGSWTLGAVAGPNTLTATSGTLSATFTATGTVGIANKLAFATPLPTSITVGVGVVVSVRLTDVNNNPVATAGVPITVMGVVTPGSDPGVTLMQTTNASGIATFALGAYTGTVGNAVFTATAPGTSALVSASIPVVAGAASKLAVLAQPPATASSGVALSPAPSVQVTDVGGNPVSGNVTITAAMASGVGTLSGTVAMPTGGSSIASFTNLIISGSSGAHTLQFSASGLTSVVSNVINLGAGAPSTMTKNAGDAQSATAGAAVITPPSVLLKDQVGNPVANVQVVFAATAGGGTVTGATTTTNGAGIATVGSWTLGSTAGTNAMTATAGVLTATFTATGLAGTGSKIAFVQLPTSITVGSGFVITARLQDALGNLVAQPGVSVGFSAVITPGNHPPFTGSITTDASGLATLTIPSYTGPSGQAQVTLSASGFTSVTSALIPVLTGPIAGLAVTTQPSPTAVQNSPFAQQPVVQLTDAGENVVPGAGVTVTAFIVSGVPGLTGTLTAVTDASGAAHFTNLAVMGVNGSRTLGFSSPGLTGAQSNTIVATTGPAVSLVIVSGNGQTGQVNTAVPANPTIKVLDAFGNPAVSTLVTFTPRSGSSVNGGTANTPVSLSSANNGLIGVSWILGPGAGALADTLDVLANGVATGVQFVATATAGAPSMIFGVIAPNPAPSGVALSPAPAVRLVDAAGNAVAVPGVLITAAIFSGGGTLSGTLQQTTNASGVATFGNLVITGAPGSRTLSYSGTGLVPNHQTVNITAGAATSLGLSGTWNVLGSTTSGFAIATQPVIQLLDAVGSPVAQAGVVVTATVASGPSSPVPALTSATATTDASGHATFSGLALTGLAGTYRLSFGATGLTSVAPLTNLIIAAGTPSAIMINAGEGQTAAAGATLPIDPTVRVVDASGNAVANVPMTFTANNGGQVHVGVATATSLPQTTTLAGQAAETWILGNSAGPQTLTVVITSGPLSGTSVTFHATATGGAASKLAIISGAPTTMTVGVAPSTPVMIQVTDVLGNAVASAGLNVSATGTVSPSNQTFTAFASTNASGLATITLPAYAGTVGSGSIVFSAASVTQVSTAAPIDVVAGGAAKLLMVTQPPTTTVSGATLTPSPTVRVTDVGGNAVLSGGANVHITASISPSGTLTGTTDVQTNLSGLATFSNLNVTGPAGGPVRLLTFASTSFGAVNSNTFNVTAGSTTKLALGTVPSSAATNGVALNQQPVIQLQDANGNSIALSGVTVTASITSGTGTLSNATAVTNANGAASFGGLTITGTAGIFTLSFADGSHTPVSSGNIGVSSGALATLTVTPGSVSLLPGSPQVFTAVGRDAQNNVVSVSPAWSVVGGGGTINIAGSFAAGSTAGSYPGLVHATSGAIIGTADVTVTTGSASQLTLTTAPSSSGAIGTPLAIQPVIQVRDAFGNAVAAQNLIISVGVLTGSGNIVNSQATTNASGVATFSGLTINGTAGNFVLQFYDGSGNHVNSASIAMIHGAASKLGIATPPSASVGSGVVFPAQPVIQITDASGNSVPQSGLTVTVTASGSPALGGTLSAVTSGSGLATFTDLVINGVTGTRTLVFSSGALTTTNASVNVVAGAGTQLALTTAPSATATNGTALAQQPVVQLRDASNNPVLTSGVVVTASVFSGAGTVTNATATTNASGVAAFSGLTISGTVGSFVLHFDAASPYTGVASGSITLGAGAIATVTVAPSSVTLASGAIQQFTATARDASGNVVAGTFTWAVIAGGGAISASGSFTASGTVGPYTNTVKATANGQPGLASVMITGGAAANITTSAGLQNAQALGSTIPSGRIKFQVRDAGANAVGAGVQVNYQMTGGQAQCVNQASYTLTASDGTATVPVTAGNTPGACVLTATINGVPGPNATARIVVAPAGATLAWFGGAAGNSTTYSTPANWVRTDGSQLNDAPGSSSVLYIPYVESGPFPQITANWTVGGVIMDGSAVLELNNNTLTSTGDLAIVNSSEYLPQFAHGTVISRGHGVSVVGDFTYLTTGLSGCGGASRDSALLVSVNVVHTLTVNCSTIASNGTVGGVVATAGSFLKTGTGGYFFASDSIKFLGDSLVVDDASTLESNSATIGGRLSLRSSGALRIYTDALFNGTGDNSSGYIVVGGNASFGGAGSAGYRFTGGNMDLQGNFTTYAGGTGTPFVAEGNHYTDFVGSGNQRINISGGHYSGNTFGTLEILNSLGGVTFETGMTMPTSESASRSVNIYDGKLTIGVGDTLNLNGGQLRLSDSPSYLTVDGALTISGSCFSNGTIAGSGTINYRAVNEFSCPGDGDFESRIPRRHARPVTRAAPAKFGRPRSGTVAIR
ncbi:MAG: hypothetical protein JWM95_918 [Gemmatimonadetes bacterium]|nr:hypothetical protein [Gemmatimonadota bacterium]